MKLFLLLLMLCSTTFASDIINLTEANSISFNSKFSGEFVAKKQMEATRKCYDKEGSDIYIVLYTPGGSVTAGLLFFDTLNALPCNFHTITIFAASMGYQTVQNLKGRYILPSGTLMSHRAYLSGIGGEIDGELDSIIGYYKQSVREMEEKSASRVGLKLEKYKKKVADELWMTGSQAVKLNHADKLVKVKCDREFKGTYIERFRSLFGSVNVEFSRCPLVVSPISVNGQSQRAVEYTYDLYKNIKNHVVLEK